MLREIRNNGGKLVAQVNEADMEVIIIQRGFITMLRFNKDGELKIVNTEAAAE